MHTYPSESCPSLDALVRVAAGLVRLKHPSRRKPPASWETLFRGTMSLQRFLM